MQIKLEMPSSTQLPSQGRNPGSIPGGSTKGNGDPKNLNTHSELCQAVLIPREKYRALIGSSATESETVFFVGWNHDSTKAIFEDAESDIHAFYTDEIDIVPAGGL